MPSFGSVLPRMNPGSPVSITNALIPSSVPSRSAVCVKTTMYFATGPDVIQAFLPLSVYVLPSADRTALARIVAASDPDCGSVSAYAPFTSPEATGFRNFCFCSSVPNSSKGTPKSELFTDTIVL